MEFGIGERSGLSVWLVAFLSLRLARLASDEGVAVPTFTKLSVSRGGGDRALGIVECGPGRCRIDLIETL